MLLKNCKASSTRISNTSAMFFPLNVISNVSLLYLFPSHTSQGTYTSGKKCISIFNIPSPRQASQRPPFTLKLKRPFLYPRTLASFVSAKTSLILSNTHVLVYGFERGILPIGYWLTSITFSNYYNYSTYFSSLEICYFLH